MVHCVHLSFCLLVATIYLLTYYSIRVFVKFSQLILGKIIKIVASRI